MIAELRPAVGVRRDGAGLAGAHTSLWI